MSHPLLSVALEHHRAGNLPQAETIYRQILAQNPNDPEALHYLGALAVKNGLADNALALFLRSLEIKPDYALAHHNLGNLFIALGRLPLAINSLRCALELDPNLPEVHTSLAHALSDQNLTAEALPHFQKAAALHPARASAQSDLADACSKLGQAVAAIAAYRQAIALDRNHAPAHVNLGIHVLKQGKFDEALALLQRAITLDPHLPEAHWNLSWILLLRGQFAQGWQEYEYRWQCKGSPTQPRDFSQPQWTGQPLAGKTLLVHAEQGLGDTIQMSRYLRLLSEQGAAVLLECPPELHTLLQTLSHPPQLLVPGNPFPPFDFHTPLLSLPLRCKTTLETIPNTVPYLSAPQRLISHFQSILTAPLTAPGTRTPEPGTRRPLRVGLAWSGHPQHTRDRERSIPVSLLAPLTQIPTIQFISLQKVPTAPETLAAGLPVRDLFHHLKDFAHTAALISNLDLIITVDTAVAHLAGALGKPTWLLLPYVPDWRWLLDRADSPWYPTMKIFRQKTPNSWPYVIDQVTTDLRAFVTSNAKRPTSNADDLR